MRTFGMMIAAVLVAIPAYAHETKGAHGGAIVDAGNHHLELVAKGLVVEVYVTDAADKPVSIEGFKGTAILIADGKPQRIVLTPATGNKLTGNANVSLPKVPKGAVQIQMPTGTSFQGKFQ
jgi:hypothetical protein